MYKMYLNVQLCIKDDKSNCGLTAVSLMEIRFSGLCFPLLRM